MAFHFGPPNLFNYLSPPDERLFTKTVLGIEKYKEERQKIAKLELEIDEYNAEADAVAERQHRESMRSEKPLPAQFGRNVSMRLLRADRPSVSKLAELSRFEPDIPGKMRLFEQVPPLEELRQIQYVEAFTTADQMEQQRIRQVRDEDENQRRQMKAILRNKADEKEDEQRDYRRRAFKILTDLEAAHKAQGYDYFDFQQARADLDI